MSYPVFQVPSGDVLPVMFSSYAGATGASITLTGLAVTDIEIYKDGSATQRASDAGYTLLDTDGIDFDTITGIHGFSIDTGDNTDAGFYTVGAWFTVVVSAVTVDSQTVNFIACQFRLMAAEGIAGKPKVDVDGWLGTACATPTVAGVPEVDLTHVAGATTNVAALATNVDAILTDTGTTLQAELDGIQADTEDIQTRLPAALVGGRIDASVGAMAAGVVTAAAIATDAIDNDAIAADVTAVMADAVWNAATATYGSAGTYGALVETNLDAAVSTRSTYAGGAVASVTGAVGSVTGLTASDVGAIKAKTDSLTFTVAGQVDANIQSINDVAITGDGGATPFNV